MTGTAWLPWAIGAALALLSVAAFLLWGTQGALILFDALVAFCA